MMEGAARAGWIDGDRALMESPLAFKQAPPIACLRISLRGWRRGWNGNRRASPVSMLERYWGAGAGGVA
jgi:hypothetical protein